MGKTKETANLVSNGFLTPNNGKLGIGTGNPEEIVHILGSTETIESRDGVTLQHSTATAAADNGLPLVWSGYVGSGSGLQNYGLASICGRKENSNADDGAAYLQFGTGNVNGAIIERLRITSDGKIGVGTEIPDYNLTIGDGSSYVIQNLKSKNDEFGEFRFGDPEGVAQGKITYDHGTDSLRFTTNGDGEKLRITSAGAVNIGGDYTQTAYKTQITGDLLVQKSQAAYLHPQIELYATSNTAHGGAIKFSGKVSGAKYQQALIRTYGGSNNTDGSLAFHTGDGTEKLRITSGGLVGVGTDNPSYELHVKGTGTVAYFEGTGGNGFIGIEDSDDSSIGFIGVDGGSLKFQTSGDNFSDKFTITSAGLVGIGTDNPNQPLHIHASGTSYVRFTDEASGTGATDGVVFGLDHPHLYAWNYEAGDFVVATNATEKLRVTSDGCLFLHDGAPSQVLNSGTKLEVRGPALGVAGVNTSFFKGFKIALDDATEFGGQVQHSVGRYEESGSSARSSYVISLGHGALNSSSDADVDVMEMRSNGCVSIPGQPAFNAVGFPSHRYMNVWDSIDLTTFNTVVQNGSYFNNSNGRFTAPVDGKYFFIYTAMFTNPNTADFVLQLRKNGNTIVLSNNHSGGGSSNGHQWNDATVQAVIDLATGDYVTARAGGSSSATCYLYGANGSTYGSFCGFLIG